MTITTEEDNNNFSNESQTTDYISIEGVRTRTGVDNDNDLGNFVIKELMDNALDDIDQNAKTFEDFKQDPYVNVTITEVVDDENIIKISVRNSNVVVSAAAGINNDILTKEQVENIFNFEKYFSNKRHRYVVKRGALGDGLKEILGIPYALAINNNNYESWNYPLQINISNERIFEVRINNISQAIRNLELPKINVITIPPPLPPQFKQQIQNNFHQDKTITVDNNNNNKFIEITVYLPKTSINYNKILWLLKKYVLINTHIDFDFKLPGIYTGLYNATQKIKDWSNYQSVYYCYLPDLERLIYSLEDKSNSNISSYLQRHFREGTNIGKEELLKILNSSSSDDDNNNTTNNKNIAGIYQRLKKMPSKKPHQFYKNPQIEVPFDRKLREQASKERFEQVFGIDHGSVKYKKIIGYYHSDRDNDNNNHKIEFPFMFEIIIANVPYLNKELHLFSTINFSPSLQYNPFFNQSREKIFTWKSKKNNNNQIKSDDSIADILEDCGYSHDPKKHKKNRQCCSYKFNITKD